MKKFLMAAAFTMAFGAASAADIVDTAKSAGSFNTLVTAVQAAGLTETLKGPGPFTVFAPTDAAFAKVPKAKLDALLKDKAAIGKRLEFLIQELVREVNTIGSKANDLTIARAVMRPADMASTILRWPGMISIATISDLTRIMGANQALGVMQIQVRASVVQGEQRSSA